MEHRLLFMGRRLLSGAWQGEEGLTTLDGIAMAWAYLEELSSKTGFIYDPENVEKMRERLNNLASPVQSDLARITALLNGEQPDGPARPTPQAQQQSSELRQMEALLQPPAEK